MNGISLHHDKLVVGCVMVKRYVVRLSLEDRQRLEGMIGAGVDSARTLAHARILLKADQGREGPGWPDARIAEALEAGHATVERVRKRCAKEGLEAALVPHPPQREYERKLDGRQEAHLIALACGPAPEGRARWSLRLLAGQLVELGEVESISHETVRQTLKKTTSSRGGRRRG